MGERSRKVLPRQDGLRLLLKGALLAGLGCGGGDIQEPGTGGITITTVTSGVEADSDGYSISIDQGAESPITINATMQRPELQPGSHMVQLGGVAPNCTVGGENPRAVTVPSGETATVSFEITCSATTGSLQITSATSGSSPDPDGYLVTLDGSDRGALAVSGTTTVTGLTPGTHSIGLSGVAANCSVEGDNPRAVVVTAGAGAAVTFTIACSEPQPGAGSLRVTTATTGTEPDADGYAFAVDGGTSQPIGASATAVLANVPPGSHQVRLSGAAANCSIQGTNPRPVTVSSGSTAEASFAITCTATSGSLTITTTTSGTTPDPDGYAVTVDGGIGQTIGVNSSLTISGLTPGRHVIALTGLVAGCAVQGESSQSITIVLGTVAQTAFTIACALPALRWRAIPSGTTNNLINISGTAADNIFVVDDQGGILHYDGRSWLPQSAPLKVSKVWTNSAIDAFATGASADGIPPLLHYDGQQWTVVFSPPVPAEIRADLSIYEGFRWGSIWGTGNDVFAVGGWTYVNDDGTSPPGYIAHYDGSVWSTDLTCAAGALTDIWGTSKDNLYVIGSTYEFDVNSFVMHKDQNGCSRIFAEGEAGFKYIWGTSASDVLVVSEAYRRFSHTIFHFDGTSWSGLFNSYGPSGAIWGSSGQTYILDGVTIYYSGTGWDPVYRAQVGLYDIWGSSATDVYVVGGNGLILHGAPRY